MPHLRAAILRSFGETRDCAQLSAGSDGWVGLGVVYVPFVCLTGRSGRVGGGLCPIRRPAMTVGTGLGGSCPIRHPGRTVGTGWGWFVSHPSSPQDGWDGFGRFVSHPSLGRDGWDGIGWFLSHPSAGPDGWDGLGVVRVPSVCRLGRLGHNHTQKSGRHPVGCRPLAASKTV